MMDCARPPFDTPYLSLPLDNPVNPVNPVNHAFHILGEGSFGQVFEYNGYAIKRISHQGKKDLKRMAENEIKVFRHLQNEDQNWHMNVVFLFADQKEEDFTYLMMTLGGLDLLAAPLELSKPERIFPQLYQGVKFLHERCVVHRDLKLENLLVDPNTGILRITDFGLSKIIPPEDVGKCVCRSSVGTGSYVAPEVWFGQRHPYNGFASDVWSMGVCLFALAYRCFPFDCTDLSKFKRSTRTRQFIDYQRAGTMTPTKALTAVYGEAFFLAHPQEPWVGYVLDSTLSVFPQWRYVTWKVA